MLCEWEEYNDNEGEYWSFFVDISPEEFNHLNDLVEEDENYSINIVNKDYIESCILSDDEDNCYMDRFTDLTSFNYEGLLEVIDPDDFYKGGIWLC